VLEVDALFLVHLEDADPLDLGIAGLVVLLHAGVDAPPAPDAPAEIQGVSEDHPRDGRLVADIDIAAELLLVLLLEPGDDLLDILLGEFPERGWSVSSSYPKMLW
jgi:hypothetical protein